MVAKMMGDGVKQGLRELEFSTRRAAEDYLSSIADCIDRVRFMDDGDDFRVSYAGGQLGRCALHRARVSAMGWSVAESGEVHIVLLQRGSLTVRSADGTATAVARRTAMLLPPAARGNAEVADDTLGISVIAPWTDVLAQAGRLTGRELRMRPAPGGIEMRDLADPLLGALARNASSAMHELLSLADAGFPELGRVQLDDLLLSLLAAVVVDEVRKVPDDAVPEAGGPLVRRAQGYIRAHAADPIRLSTLAESLGIGMRALQIAFRRQLGMSPREYLMSCRLELARARLVSGDATTRISTVAFDCGFTDLALFSRKYRQTFGELPSATLRRR